MTFAPRTHNGQVTRFGQGFLVLLGLMCVPAIARAQTTVTLDAPRSEVSADTTVRGGGYASVNYSTSDILEVKPSSDSTNRRRILLKFDTQNLIPAGAVINSAKLMLVLKSAGDGASRPIEAFRVAKSFSGSRNELAGFKVRDSMEHSRRRPGGKVHHDVRRELRRIDLHVRRDAARPAHGQRRVRVTLHANRAGRPRVAERQPIPFVPFQPRVQYRRPTSTRRLLWRDVIECDDRDDRHGNHSPGDAVEHPQDERHGWEVRPQPHCELGRKAQPSGRLDERGQLLLWLMFLQCGSGCHPRRAPREQDRSDLVSQVRERGRSREPHPVQAALRLLIDPPR